MVKNQTKPIPMINTGLVFNGCKVCLSAPPNGDPDIIKKFAHWMGRMMHRSRQTTMGDIYATHIAVGQKIKALKKNESLFN